MSSTKNIFAIYASQDKNVVQYLLLHLQPLEKDFNVAIWHDDPIYPEQLWKPKNIARLDRADIVLLLVSDAFMLSEFVKQDEFKMVIDKYKEGKSIVIPILLEDCPWDIDFNSDDYDFNLRELQVFPRDGKPISDWNSADQVFMQVSDHLKEVITSLAGNLDQVKPEERPKKNMAKIKREEQIEINFAEEKEVNSLAEAEIRGEVKKLKEEAEAIKRVEEEQMLKEEAEAKRMAIEELRLKEEAEVKKRVEEEKRLKEEEEAKKRLEKEQRLKEKAEAKKRVEEEQRLEQEDEAKRIASEETRLQEEEEQRLKEEAETERIALEETRHREEAEVKKRVEKEQRLKEDAETERIALEEQRLWEAAEDKKNEDEEKRLGEEVEAKRRAEQEARLREEAQARKRIEEENSVVEKEYVSVHASDSHGGVEETQQEKDGNVKKRILKGFLIAAIVITVIWAFSVFDKGSEKKTPTLPKIEAIDTADSEASVNAKIDSLNQGTSFSKLAVGDTHGGGIIFAIDQSNKTGRIAYVNDSGPMPWKNAMNIHEQLGEGWRLPTMDELQLMYQTIGQGATNSGQFADELYWSATSFDTYQARLLRFRDGNTSYHYNKNVTHRKFHVRAVRDFGQ